MATISDLSCDLVEEILVRVPITCLGALRLTCKRWNTLSKSRLLCKAEANEQVLGFMLKNSKLCSLRFGVHDDEEEFTVKDLFNQVEVCEALVCDGLLLCVTVARDENNIQRPQGLMLWNPYLGQTRWIQPPRRRGRCYENGSEVYALGYDISSTNRNHKILRYCKGEECEIYNVESGSWRTLGDDVPPHWGCGEVYFHLSASVKGNTYFLDRYEDDHTFNGFLVCFDFTTERFGELLPLPLSGEPSYYGRVTPISSFRQEKLTALYMRSRASGVEVWVTTKTDPDELLLSNLFKINLEAVPCAEWFVALGFFIDQEKRRVVVFSFGNHHVTINIKSENEYYDAAYIIGENDFFKIEDLGGTDNSICYCSDLVMCSSNSYVPSLVQINQ